MKRFYEAESTTFLLAVFGHKTIKGIDVDLTLGYNRVSSTNFIQIISLSFARFLKDCCRQLVVYDGFSAIKLEHVIG